MIHFKRLPVHVIAAVLATLVYLTTAAGTRADIVCGATQCTCKNDTECNIMFTSKCSGSGGSCKQDNGGNTSCSCTKKASTKPPPNNKKGPAPVGNLKKSNQRAH